MNANNPLRIFSKDQLATIDRESLKYIKKEVLLEFQLSSSTSINLNGYLTDKNGVLEIFEELDKNLPLYLFINNNKTLNTFLNKGSAALLNDKITIENIKGLTDYKNEIEQKITAALQPMITGLVMKPIGTYQLISIKRFLEDINPSLVNEAYSKAYDELKRHLEYLDEKYKTPFSGQTNTNFHLGLGKYISVNFYQNLEQLPDTFNSLKRQYGYWCNNNIIYEAFQREKEFAKYSKESLRILRNAAKVAANIHNEEANLTIANNIQIYLENHVERSSVGRGTRWVIVAVILFSLKLIMSLGTCSNNSSNDNDHIQQELYDFMREKEKADKKRQNDHIATFRNEKNNSLDFIGDKKGALNAKLIKNKEHKTFTELTFSVDVLPTKYKYFGSLVPKELAEKHKGSMRTIVMNFKHPKIKSSILKHRLKFDFKSKTRGYPLDYDFKKSESYVDMNLSVKKIHKSNFPLKGVISRSNVENMTLKHASEFTIDYSESTSEYIVTYLPSRKKLTFSQKYISKLDPKYAMEEVDKFAIALKNMNELDKKYLTQGDVYTITNAFGYSIEPSIKKDYPSKKIKKELAWLKFYITSEEDNTSYVELRGNFVNLKYYVNYSTGRMKGLTMINFSDGDKEVERITLFGDNN